MRILVLVYATTLLWQPDAATVMSQAAANVERAADARKQYVYQQSVRSSLTRSSGQRERRERREYSVIPNETRTDKKLVHRTVSSFYYLPVPFAASAVWDGRPDTVWSLR